MMKVASVTWVEGLQFVGEAGQHAVIMDSKSTEGGGKNSGPSPMEMVLMGVLGCTGMDVVSILQKKRQNLQGLKIHAEAQQAETPPNYYTHIALEYVAFGDVELDALARAIELSEVKYCSAINTLNGKTSFSTTYRVEKAEPSARPAVAKP